MGPGGRSFNVATLRATQRHRGTCSAHRSYGETRRVRGVSLGCSLVVREVSGFRSHRGEVFTVLWVPFVASQVRKHQRTDCTRLRARAESAAGLKSCRSGRIPLMFPERQLIASTPEMPPPPSSRATTSTATRQRYAPIRPGNRAVAPRCRRSARKEPRTDRGRFRLGELSGRGLGVSPVSGPGPRTGS